MNEGVIKGKATTMNEEREVLFYVLSKFYILFCQNCYWVKAIRISMCILIIRIYLRQSTCSQSQIDDLHKIYSILDSFTQFIHTYSRTRFQIFYQTPVSHSVIQFETRHMILLQYMAQTCFLQE